MPDLSLAPRFSLARVAELVAQHWAEPLELVALAGERDQNFRVVLGGGEVLVVKITSAEEERPLLDAQHEAFALLREQIEICPELVPTRSGASVATVRGAGAGAGAGAAAAAGAGAGAHEHLIRAVRFIPGTPMAGLAPAEVDDVLLEQLGARLGRVDRALLGFDRPALHREFDWDLAAGEAVIRRNAHLIADLDTRAQLDELVARYVEHSEPHLHRLRRSTIHADANDHNIIVDASDDAGPRIVGLIDFGDMVHSYTVGELAIAAAYAVLDRPEPLDVIAALCRGYQSELALERDEIAAFYGLLCLRLGVSAALAANAIRQRPGDAYLEVSQGPIRRTLPRLLERPFALVRELVHDACSVPMRPRVRPTSTLRTSRRAHTLASTRLAYAEPIHLRRGWMQYLYDAEGRRYLDAYNNVPHVGHSHPRVVAAALAQSRRLATNTRYLYEALPEYAELLAATLPGGLEVCAFVNSASEANELALRLARAATGSPEVVVLDHAYHGHTTSLIDISPYKHAGPGGRGAPAWVSVAPMPDRYRGVTAELALAGLDRCIAAIEGRGARLGAFIAETCPSVGGQHLLPAGYLGSVYARVRAAGGIVIADEVQTGFGRLGSHFYAFEDHAVVPDIVVLGKPIGNGFPLAAVVTTVAIAEAFDDGMEFFSTFGGNPVACEVGLAVLEVLEEERLQAQALAVGERLLAGLHALAGEHEALADVRGRGLFLGVELVRDRASKRPDAELATRIVNAMRERGVLIGTDGPAHNVLKIRPPMPFGLGDADQLIDALSRVLGGL